MSKFTAIVAAFLITFTVLLITKTLQIQHSCSPMIDWGGKISAKCQVATKDNLNFHDLETIVTPEVTKSETKFDQLEEKDRPKFVKNKSKNESNKIDQDSNNSSLKPEQKSDNDIAVEKPQNNSNLKKESNPVINFVQEHREDEIGIVAGGIAAGTAAAATAIAAAPITGAVLIGLGVWFLIRTGLKSLK